MKVFDIKLKEQYPFLDVNGADPIATVYLQKDITEGVGSPFKFLRPVMVLCPGGGYAAVCDTEGEAVAIDFMRSGFNVVMLKYSVLPHRFPQALREVAATVDLIYKNADEWNVDVNRIAVSGFSAGGHLAASYCTLRNCPEVTSVIEPKPVQAAVLCYPVLNGMPIEGAGTGHTETIRNLSGSSIMTEEIQAKFNLDRHVKAGVTPPTFIWHTAGDRYVPVEASLMYINSLIKEDIPYEIHVFTQGVHGLATCDRRTRPDFDSSMCKTNYEWLGLAATWLKQLFGV